MSLFRLISWPYFRRHVLRTVLTAVGIVVGVSVFVGMRAANQTVLLGFENTVDRIAGKTQLEVTAGENGFGEDVLDRVQAASTVQVAVPAIEVVVDPHLAGQGALMVLAVDMTGDRSLREYDLDEGEDTTVDDPLVFLAQPDSLIVSKEFADRNQLHVNSRLRIGSVDGEKTLVVRGVMKPSGLMSAFGGNMAVMDIYAAQKMFGRGRTFDRIDLAVKNGVSIADCEHQLSALLGPGFEIRPPAARGQQFEAILASYSTMIGISSAFALFIGMFIIYNAFSIAVTERRTEIGILRALGATRRQIRSIFLWESVAIGFLGAMAGSVFGLLIARAIASFIATLLTDVFGVAQRGGDMPVEPVVLALAVAVGVITSVAAAVLPAMSAARIDPVKVLQRGKYQQLAAGQSSFRLAAAIVLAVASGICLTLTVMRPLFYLGYGLALVVALLLAPLLSLWLSQVLRPLLQLIRPVEGALAADSLIQAPRRTSSTVAGLMLSLALVVAFSGVTRASYDSILDWMKVTLNPDLFVMPSQSLDVQTIRFPEDMAPQLAAVPGVRAMQLLRNGRITFRNTPVMVVAIEMTSVAQLSAADPVAGNRDDMYRRAAAGEGLIVSENFAQLQHVSLGDVLDVPAPYGVVRLPVVGVVIDYSDQQGAILLDRSVFIKYWHDDTVNVFRVYVQPGATVAAVREGILKTFAGRRQVFVMTNGELRNYVLKVTNQWFGLTTIQIAIAVLVAVLGIANTLTVSITDRRRELGVLRAVGAVRAQVRQTIWLEAAAIGAVGLILGAALGAVNLFYVLQMVYRDVAGMRLHYEFPFGTLLALVPIILGAAIASSLWPAEAAVRGSLIESLEYE